VTKENGRPAGTNRETGQETSERAATATSVATVAVLDDYRRLRARKNKPSVWSQLDAWAHARRDQRLRFLDAIETAHRDAQHRRRLVLSHKDIAERLVTELGYQRPDQWNGYVPPKLAEYHSKNWAGGVWLDGVWVADPVSGPLNTSPRRRVLLEIVAAAVERERSLR
jgi:hypothetical protein